MPATEYKVKARSKEGKLVESKMKVSASPRSLLGCDSKADVDQRWPAGRGLQMEINLGKGKVAQGPRGDDPTVVHHAQGGPAQLRCLTICPSRVKAGG